jgi:HK97 gp10 family phage protein
VDSAQRKMEEPKAGKIYIINGRRHQASAPGQAPAIITGDLKNSVRYELKGSDLLFGAGNNEVDYAKFLELGTKKMAKRPFIEITARENYKNIENAFDAEFKRTT